jgi:hypothetical protein
MTSKTNSSWIDNVRNETRNAQRQYKLNANYWYQAPSDEKLDHFKRLVEKQAKKGQNQMWIPNQSNYIIVKLRLLGLDIKPLRHNQQYCFGNA